MGNKTKIQLAVGTFIVSGLSSYSNFTSSTESTDNIFELKATRPMQRCYWLSREAPDEGLCGQKMKPDLAILTQEAKKGNAIAALRLGQLYESGNWGVKADLKLAVQWHSEAAKLGNRVSQIRLGNAFEFGRMGVDTDLELAIQYYRLATQNGIFPDLEERIEQLENELAAISIKQESD